MKVHEALAAVMADVSAVGKTERNKQQGFNFRGIDAVLNAVGPAFRTHGVVPFPKVLDAQFDKVFSKGGTEARQATLTVEYTFVGPEGDSLSCVVIGETVDYGDKSVPQAMSVAYRIALLQVLAIPTDEADPDGKSFERGSNAPQRPALPEGHVTRGEAKTALLEALGGDKEEAHKVWEIEFPDDPVTVPAAAMDLVIEAHKPFAAVPGGERGEE